MNRLEEDCLKLIYVAHIAAKLTTDLFCPKSYLSFRLYKWITIALHDVSSIGYLAVLQSLKYRNWETIKRLAIIHDDCANSTWCCIKYKVHTLRCFRKCIWLTLTETITVFTVAHKSTLTHPPWCRIYASVNWVIYLNQSLRWRHNGCDCVSNHQPYDCLLKRLFGRRSK